MQYVVKIYAKQDSNTPIAQISDILDVSINEDINGISSCLLTLGKDTKNIAQYRKVELYEVTDNNEDILVFLGYIDSFVPKVDRIECNCKNEKGLLARKIVTQDRLLTGQTITTLVTTLLNDWNTLYGEDWTITSSIATTVGMEVKKGDNFYDIIDELATTNGAVWTCENRVIRVEVLLGTDYTTPSNFKELVYNGENAIENNIDNIEYESFGTISNVIIGDDGTNRLRNQDTTSITEFGALGEYVNFRPGDLTANVANYLASKKGQQFVYNVVTSPFKFTANVGDKVQLRIENVSDYFNFSGNAIINTKRSKIVNGTKIVEYGVSETYVYFDSFIKRFLAVESGLNLKNVR